MAPDPIPEGSHPHRRIISDEAGGLSEDFWIDLPRYATAEEWVPASKDYVKLKIIDGVFGDPDFFSDGESGEEDETDTTIRP